MFKNSHRKHAPPRSSVSRQQGQQSVLPIDENLKGIAGNLKKEGQFFGKPQSQPTQSNNVLTNATTTFNIYTNTPTFSAQALEQMAKYHNKHRLLVNTAKEKEKRANSSGIIRGRNFANSASKSKEGATRSLSPNLTASDRKKKDYQEVLLQRLIEKNKEFAGVLEEQENGIKKPLSASTGAVHGRNRSEGGNSFNMNSKAHFSLERGC